MQCRGFATEKQIFDRIQATKNISKITSSMKMVSASKLRGDQQRLENATPFNAWAERLSGSGVTMEDMDFSGLPQKNLVIAITSDRGLCGGVNNVVGRNLRKMMEAIDASGKEAKLCVIGEKGRGIFRRQFGDRMEVIASDLTPPINFATVSAITTETLNVGEFDAIHIVFNKFLTAISYDTRLKTMTPLQATGENESLPEYEVEPDAKQEIMQDLTEMMVASQLYHSVMEAATAEQSSRMNAMENASKNAGEMIEKLTLQYNRARQARITTELIEIISGASALED